ncbi:MAG: HEPN domain-containing protein [Actinobacteria bacterium]|nr:HEPN domain-containing protein [Actinomycetota bacterium]
MASLSDEWLKQSDYDFNTAKDMFQAGRYIYTIYMCHLAIEKALKSLVVITTREAPPRTHNLIQLAKLGSANLNTEQIQFIAEINTASITTRYPDELEKSLTILNRDVAMEYLIKSEDVIKCIALDNRLLK